MTSIRKSGLVLGLVLAFAPLASLSAADEAAQQQAPVAAPSDWRETWAYSVVMQAVIYGYPVVKNTNVRFGMIERPNGQADMPLNTWFHSRRASDATDKLARFANTDILQSARVQAGNLAHGLPTPLAIMMDEAHLVAQWGDKKSAEVFLQGCQQMQRYVDFYTTRARMAALARHPGQRCWKSESGLIVRKWALGWAYPSSAT